VAAPARDRTPGGTAYADPTPPGQALNRGKAEAPA
jgi:hypothetical protein